MWRSLNCCSSTLRLMSRPYLNYHLMWACSLAPNYWSLPITSQTQQEYTTWGFFYWGYHPVLNTLHPLTHHCTKFVPLQTISCGVLNRLNGDMLTGQEQKPLEHTFTFPSLPLLKGILLLFFWQSNYQISFFLYRLSFTNIILFSLSNRVHV